jgi:hypothetical protein
MKFLKKVETPNLDSLNVNKRADYSSYNTAVENLISKIRMKVIIFSSQHGIYTTQTLIHSL